MNEARKGLEAGKWGRISLKSSWYDDHYGFAATPLEVVENRLRIMAERFEPSDDERIASDEIERFFDLFEAPEEH